MARPSYSLCSQAPLDLQDLGLRWLSGGTDFDPMRGVVSPGPHPHPPSELIPKGHIKLLGVTECKD